MLNFYSDMFAPGQNQIYAISDLRAASDGQTIYATAQSFAGPLEAGPTSCVVAMSPHGSIRRLSSTPSRLLRPARHANAYVFVQPAPNGDILHHSAGWNWSAPGRIEHVDWSADDQRLVTIVAAPDADFAGFQGGSPGAGAHVARADGWVTDVRISSRPTGKRTVFVIDLAVGKTYPLAMSANPWEACWCGPDTIALIASDDADEAAWYSADIRMTRLTDGVTRRLYQPVDQIGHLCAASDGSAIAFVEAFCSDRGLVCGTAKLLAMNSAEPVTLPLGTMEASSLAWRDAQRLTIAGQIGAKIAVLDFDIVRGGVVWAWEDGEHACGEWHPSAAPLGENETAIVVESFSRAPALAIVKRDHWARALDFASSASKRRQDAFGPVSSVWWRAPDGENIQGWLVEPGPHAPKPWPLLVDIHGGPVWTNRNRWMARARATPLLVEDGFAVLFPNPRGSAGFGQRFANLVRGDMGGADALDILAGIDALVEQGVVDADRVACTGSSYGGFMTAWLAARERRFAAAAPISPISNWYSQHLTSHVPTFDELFLNDRPDRADGRYHARSPALNAAGARTPTLILAGALDQNTPASQALELFNAFRLTGCETVLVTYPSAGHSLRESPAYFDSAARILNWVALHCGK